MLPRCSRNTRLWLVISRQERCAHWLRLRERGSSRSQICRRSRNPATPTTKWTCGGSSSHRQKRKEALKQLAKWFTEALRAPEVKAKLDAQGFAAVGMCGADFGALPRRQFDHYGRVIREANITPE